MFKIFKIQNFNTMEMLNTGFCLVGIWSGYMFRPRGGRPKPTVLTIKTPLLRRLTKDLQLWKNKVFVIWCVAITFAMFGYYIPYVHLVSNSCPIHGLKLWTTDNLILIAKYCVTV